MINNLSEDSLATLLICSNLGINFKEDDAPKPYSLSQWNKLTTKIINSKIQRPGVLLNANKEVLKKELFMNDEQVERLDKLLNRGGQIGVEIEQLESKGIFITTRAEENYPNRLKQILKKKSPPVLFYCGDLELLNNSGIAIVGSRNVDKSGLDFTKLLSTKCSNSGLTIISGGAKGVDSIAENTALKSGGRVISIVADGLANRIKNKNTRQEIMARKLLLISAVNPYSRFRVYTAMDRNKYVYALSQYTIVISSDYNKGGTWTGATENLKNGWVPLYVRDESDIPKGNKELLKLDTKPIGRDIVEDNNIHIIKWFKDNKKELSKSDAEKQIVLDNWISSISSEQDKVKDNTDKISEDGEQDKIKENESMKEVDIVEELNTNLDINYNFDLYDVVIPYIEKALETAMNQSELCEAFNIKKSQMSYWINRALEEKRIIKLNNPVKYKVNK